MNAKRLLALLCALCLLMGTFAIAEDEEISMEELLLEEEEDELEEAATPIPEYAEEDLYEGFYIGSEEVENLDLIGLDDADIDESINPDDLELNPNLPDNVLNILLIGVDSRDRDLDTGSQRADVQIILSVNRETGDLKLSSIMRDLYITIPGLKSKNRINVSYSGKSGGPTRTMRTINHNFEMNVQYYVTINFYGLASIIDSLGGIDIELTKSEAGAINAYLKAHPPKYDNTDGTQRVPLEKVDGVQHLDGIQAVMYARLRKIDSDFNRTARQRHLLELLLEKAMEDMSLEKVITLIESCIPYVKTNLEPRTMLSLAMDVLQSGLAQKASSGEELLNQFRIPMDGTHKYATVENVGSVLQFRSDKRMQENVEGLHEFIYGQYYPAK